MVFAPWAFGSTEDWSIWTMNIAAYALGLLWIGKRFLRQQTGFRPAYWGTASESGEPELFNLNRWRRDPLVIGMAVLTVFVLLYILVSALNARAIYIEWQRRFEYRDCISWLPHSYDRSSTWFCLWMYLGLACFFWATRDWLLTKTSRERRRTRRSDDSSESGSALRRESSIAPVIAIPGVGPGPALAAEPGTSELPFRLRLLLWVFCINGAVLALESILQRLSGTNKLLWLAVPHFNTTAPEQFGPYAYRANAATYFNLIWPVCLGFWLVLRRSAKPSLRSGHRLGSGSHIVLLPGAVLMAACPIVSTSRGGALIAVGIILITMGMLLWIARRESLGFRLGTCSLFLVILAFSAFLGLKDLAHRMQTIFTDQMSRRTEIYANAVPIARDFPVFGTGPGSFGALYQLYRTDVGQEWAAYVHDDWLETRITFGWVGFSALLAVLGLAVAKWFGGRGIPASWDFAAMIWVSVGGALLHAKFDFPFQVYSLLMTFILLLAILSTLARRPLDLSA